MAKEPVLLTGGPLPPVASKSGDTRYFHIHEGNWNEAQFADWVRQASELPGEKL